MLQRLSSVLGRPASSLASAGEVRGEIRAGAGGGWELLLEIREPSAPTDAAVDARVLRASVCDDLADAAAVAIAIALGGGARPTAPPVASEPVAVSAATPPLPSRATHDAAEVPIQFVPSVELVLDSASLGAPAFGASVQAQLRFSALGVGLYGLWLAPRELGLGEGQRVEFSLLTAGLRGCYRAGADPLSIDFCGALELGSFGAAANGLVAARDRSDPWWAASWGAAAGIDLVAGLRVVARLEALIPLTDQEYVVNGDELVFRVPDTSLRVGLGFEGTL